MNIIEVLNYPENWILGLIFTGIGYSIKYFVDNYSEKKKKRIELQELYWKEKIKSAKKASEYYLYHLGFFNLTADKYEMIEENKEGMDELVMSMEEQIKIYKTRLLNFPHFEHFHINIFYDFEETESRKIMKENYQCMQSIHSINSFKSETNLSLERKINILKGKFKIMKENNRKLIEIYNGYLKTIRDDIKTLPYK